MPDLTHAAPAAESTGDQIEGLRLVLDLIDRRILGLLVMRSSVSGRVVQLRRERGQGRLDPARETVIVGRYRDVLGDPGAAIARQVLRAGRGPDPTGGKPCGQ